LGYQMRRTWSRIREPVHGATGAFTGLALTEFAAEYTSRVAGQTSYKKAAVKSGVKLLIGGLFWGAASRFRAWSLFYKVAAFAGWGSIGLDWIAARWPGGITGLAERLAVTGRLWARGAQKVTAEMSALEKARTIRGAAPAVVPAKGISVDGVTYDVKGQPTPPILRTARGSYQ